MIAYFRNTEFTQVTQWHKWFRPNSNISVFEPLDHLIQNVSQVGSHLLLAPLWDNSNTLKPYQPLHRVCVHHQLPAEFDADIEHILRVEAVRDAVQDAHGLLLRFTAAVLVLGLLQGREVVSSFNHWLDGVLLLEVFAAVGHDCFDDVQTHFAGVETDLVHAWYLNAELHDQVQVCLFVQLGGVGAVVGVQVVHETEWNSGHLLLFTRIQHLLALGQDHLHHIFPQQDIIVTVQAGCDGE